MYAIERIVNVHQQFTCLWVYSKYIAAIKILLNEFMSPLLIAMQLK